MIDYAGFCQIQHLHAQQGLSAAQIAATLSLDPRTVAYWLTQERFRPRKARQRALGCAVVSADVSWANSGLFGVVPANAGTDTPRRQ